MNFWTVFGALAWAASSIGLILVSAACLNAWLEELADETFGDAAPMGFIAIVSCLFTLASVAGEIAVFS